MQAKKTGSDTVFLDWLFYYMLCNGIDGLGLGMKSFGNLLFGGKT